MSGETNGAWGRKIEGQVIWITGAGTGIGSATALRLAAAGAVVVLTGRRAELLEETAAQIKASGGKSEVRAVDVVDRAAMLAAGAEIADRYGRIDMLFGNAGINVTPRSWDDVVADTAILDDWDRVLDINVKGVWNGIAAVLPAMRRQKDGVIVTTSSMAGELLEGGWGRLRRVEACGHVDQRPCGDAQGRQRRPGRRSVRARWRPGPPPGPDPAGAGAHRGHRGNRVDAGSDARPHKTE